MGNKASNSLFDKSVAALIAVLLLVLTCTSANAQQGMTIPSSHPRLWWTPARITQAQTWYASHPFTPASDDPLGNAFRYICTGETSYAQTAINLLMAFTIPDPEGQYASDLYRWNDWVPLVYDWCYNEMTPTQRQTFMDRYDGYVDIQRQKAWGGPTMPMNNYYTGFFRNELNWAIATWYESSMASTFLDWACVTRWQNAFLPYAATGTGLGGVAAEGTQYGKYMLGYPVCPLTTAGLLGRDMYRETNFYKEALFYYIYATSTGTVYNKGGASQYYQMYSFDDSEQNPFPPAADFDYGNFIMAVAKEWNGQPVGAYARYALNTIQPSASNWVAAVDSGGSATSFSGLPLDYFAPGYRNLYVKNSWSAAATQANIQIGHINNGGGHQHLDCGSFHILRGDRWLTRETPGYSNTTTGWGGNGTVGTEATINHNSLLFTGNGWTKGVANAYQDGETNVTRLESQPNYSYIAADLTGTYQARTSNYTNGDGSPRDDNPFAQTVVREFLFIRPLETFVIFDRVLSCDNTRFPPTVLAANAIKTFVLHSENSPTIQDSSHVLMTNGNQALRLTTLVPSNPQYVTVYDNNNAGADWAQYRLEINHSGEAQSYFLNVLQARASGGTDVTASVVDNGGSYTVTMTHPTLGNATVVFQKGATSSGGQFGYVASGTPTLANLTTSVQGISVTDNGPVWGGSSLTITTSSMPADTVGVAYNQTLTATGGATPYTWAISSGSLPAGLSIVASTGAITGTPTTSGTSSFTARVTDNAAATATKALSIVINATPSITTSSLPGGTVGTAYNQTLAASGGTTPLTWSLSSGSLPAGLSLVASTGAITGTPTASGTSNFTARVSDSVGATATKALSIAVTGGSSLTITTSSLSADTVGIAYNQTLAASGGTAPYTWSLQSGSLPAGLSLVAGTGAITGTPTAAGTSSFTAKVTDNVAATASKALSIVINAAPSITTSSLPAGTVSTLYNQTLAATGGTTPITWAISSGSLPAGLSLVASTGVISGTPTASGTSSFTARVTDNLGATATKALSIAVNPSGGQTNVTFQDGLSGYTGTTDTWLNSDYPTTNYGSDTNGHLQYNTADRQLHRFDVSSIPAGSTVNSATIYFYAYNVTGGTPGVSCYRVLTHWDEMQATWNNRLTGTAWGAAGLQSGVDYNATAIGAATVSAPGWVSYSITSTVQGWVNGSYVNEGVVYRETSAGHCYTYMSEYATASSRPKLDVTYTPPSGPGITTSGLPADTVGVAYNQTLTATGGTTPYTWSLQAGSLPAGLSLNASTGAITGTPTTAGTSNFTAKVTDNVAATATKALSIVINAVVTVTTASLPADTVGIAYNQTLAATGGTGARTWSLSSGSLPVGLSLNGSTGAITGTPTTAGTSSFTAKATDTVGASGTKALSIAINAAPSITTASLPGGTVGVSYNQTLTATGGTTPRTWSLSSGTLPAGLSLVAGTGVISGTPTTSGTANFTARVTDNVGATATKALSITVTGGLTITTASLPADTVGVAYNQTLAAAGGTTPYTWSLLTGSLPAGLSLVAGTGAITGTPTTAGTSNFTAKVTDNVAATASKALSVAINAAVTITTASLPAGTINVAYNQTLTATGGTGAKTWSIQSGTLPAGLSLNAGTGAITGTPTASGTSSFTAKATDTVSASATKALSIVVTASSEPVYQFAASDTEASTTATTYQTKTTLTFTPQTSDTWVILAFAEFKEDSSSWYTNVRMTVDGTTEADMGVAGNMTGDYRTFGASKVATLSAASHTILLTYCTSRTYNTAYIRNARIVAIKKAALETWTAAADTATALTTTMTNYASTTFTPATAGDYLLIYSAELYGNTTSYYTEAQAKLGGTVLDDCISTSHVDSGNYWPYVSFKMANLPASAQTVAIAAAKQSGSSATHNIRRARVTAIRLSGSRFAGYQSAISDTESTTALTAFQNKLTQSWSVSTAGNWLMLTSFRLANSSTSYGAEAQVQIDNATTSANPSAFSQVTSDYIYGGSMDVRNLATGTRMVDVDYRSSNTSGTAKIRYVHFVALPL